MRQVSNCHALHGKVAAFLMKTTARVATAVASNLTSAQLKWNANGNVTSCALTAELISHWDYFVD